MKRPKPLHPRVKDRRGNSYDRKRRREQLIEKHGKGPWIWCHHCKCKMRADSDTWDVDRIVCELRDGGYVRSNIVPSCVSCNRKRCIHGRHDKLCDAAFKRIADAIPA